MFVFAVEGFDVFEGADFVVLAGDDFQECAGVGDSCCEEVDQGFGGGDEGVDAGGVVGCVGVFGEVLQASSDSVVDLFACAADLGGVEQPEAEVACDVADDGVSGLGGDDETFEDFSDGGVGGFVGGVVEPVVEEGGDDRYLVFDALQGEEDSVDCFFEFGTAGEVVDVVVAEGAGEFAAERFRETLDVDIE